MTDAPDPLGKRALFWAPAQRQDPAPRSNGRDLEGKRALYSARPSAPSQKGRAKKVAAAPTVSQPDAAEVSELQELVDDVSTTSARPRVAGLLGQVTVECGSCGTTRDVDMVRYASLHLPFFLVRPGRGFTHFMTCPSCRRRTWVSASWKFRPR